MPLAFTAGNVLGLAVDHFLVSNLLTAAIALCVANQFAERPVSIARNYLLGARRFIPLLINDAARRSVCAVVLGVGIGCYSVISGVIFALRLVVAWQPALARLFPGRFLDLLITGTCACRCWRLLALLVGGLAG